MPEPCLFTAPTRQDQILERLGRFHRQHPEVFSMFCGYAKQVAAKRQRYSSRCILERIRWHLAVEAQDSHGFKVNDHFSPYYGRMFELRYPEHAGLFERRVCKSANRDAYESDLSTRGMLDGGVNHVVEDFLRDLLGDQ